MRTHAATSDRRLEQAVTVRRSDATALLTAILAAGAGLLHLAVVRPHLRESLAYGLLMLGVAWVLLGVAVLLVTAPTRRVRVGAALVLVAIAASYTVSRTVGLPFSFPPFSGEPEETRILGFVTTAVEFVAAAVVLTGLRWRPRVRTGHPALAGGAAAAGLAGLVSAALLLTPVGHGHGSANQTSGEGHAERAGGHAEQSSGNTAQGTGTEAGGGDSPSAAAGGDGAHPGDGHTHAPGEGH